MTTDIKSQIKAEVDAAIAENPKIAALADAIGRVQSGPVNAYADDPGYEPHRRAYREIVKKAGVSGKASPKIHVRAKDESAEIEIYDPIDEEPFGVSAKMVTSELKALRKKGVKSLDLRINSPGGSVFEAQAIYARLQEWPGNITVHVDSLAASAASVIAMAGDKIKMAAGAQMMIHAPWTIAIGNARDFRDTADLLDRVQRSITKAYTARTGLDEKKVGDLLNHLPDGTWMDAEQAVELGFADEVVEPVRVAASYDVGRWLDMYNAPKKVVEELTSMSVDDAEKIVAEMVS